jgi:hypothetical protein
MQEAKVSLSLMQNCTVVDSPPGFTEPFSVALVLATEVAEFVVAANASRVVKLRMEPSTSPSSTARVLKLV